MPGDINLRAFGSITGDVKSSTGGTNLTAWTNMTGDVTAQERWSSGWYGQSSGNLESYKNSVTPRFVGKVSGSIKSAPKAVVVAKDLAISPMFSARSTASIASRPVR